MLRRFAVMAAAAAVAAVCPGLMAGAGPAAAATRAAAARPASAGTWGTAEEVPGTAALNTGGYAVVASVSCTSPGNCGAGGFYNNSGEQAFVVSEADGTWGTAEEVPGTAALNTGGNASVTSVSCVSAGNCTAGGLYAIGSSGIPSQAFVVSEENGTWGTAKTVAAAINKGGFARILSVSCASPGNCSAGGDYRQASGTDQAFVISEKNGAWGSAKPVATALNKGNEGAGVRQVSCATPGNCGASGEYTDSSGHIQAFVVTKENGTWGSVRTVAATLNTGGDAGVSVSCAAAGNCGAAGSYAGENTGLHVFVVNEKNGIWGTAKRVAGLSNATGGEISSVSCATAGNCTAVGYYDAGRKTRALAVSETNGTWGAAQQVTSGRRGPYADIYSVSCASPGNCSAGGSAGGIFYQQAFVVSQTGGTWGTGDEVPGSAALNQGHFARVETVSCATAGNCSAGGYYKDASGVLQAFVADETSGSG